MARLIYTHNLCLWRYGIRLIVWGMFISLFGCSYFDSTPTPPIKIPIALHQAGSVAEADIEIEQDDGITFLLVFFINDQPGHRDHLLDFLGRSRKDGAEVPLKIRVTKYATPKNSVILDRTYLLNQGFGVAAKYFDKTIDSLNISAGKYRIRIETIEAFPQLLDTQVQLAIYYVRAPK
ncbi:MAG: DUF5625 family protein [Methylovulum sp.]|nr:DUF5625 family protein [Methylovulum sp.]